MFSVVTNVSAVQEVLDDFQVKSPVASAAQLEASTLILLNGQNHHLTDYMIITNFIIFKGNSI